MFGHGVNSADSAASSVASLSMLPPPKPRKRKAPTLRESDWEPYRERITELYATKMPLKVVKHTIESETGFCAEIRQYKSRISQWKLDRNIKSQEMKYIVNRRQTRKLVEVDKEPLAFEIRGDIVDDAKIDRWMNSRGMSVSALYPPSPGAQAPSTVSCQTISDRGSPAPSSPGSSLHPDPTPPRTDHTALDHLRQSLSDLVFMDRQSQDFSNRFTQLKRAASDYFGMSTGFNYRGGSVSHWLFVPYGASGQADLQPETLGLWIQCCLQIGVSLEDRTFGHQTLLLYAAEDYIDRSSMYMRVLIEYGANVHAVDRLGRGALALLCGSKRSWCFVPEVSEAKLVVLLEAGCDPNHVDGEGMAPSDYAKRIGRAWNAWKRVLIMTKGRRMVLEFEKQLGIEGALGRITS